MVVFLCVILSLVFLLLILVRGTIAFAVIPSLLQCLLLVVIAGRLSARVPGLDVLFESHHGPFTALCARAPAHGQNGLKRRAVFVRHWLAVGRLLEHWTIFLLWLLDDHFRDIGQKQDQAFIDLVLDQPKGRRDRRQNSQPQTQ